jgi:hypothetical protein
MLPLETMNCNIDGECLVVWIVVNNKIHTRWNVFHFGCVGILFCSLECTIFFSVQNIFQQQIYKLRNALSGHFNSIFIHWTLQLVWYLICYSALQFLAVYSVQASQDTQNSVHGMAGFYLNHTILGNGRVFINITNDFGALLWGIISSISTFIFGEIYKWRRHVFQQTL